MTLSKLWVLVEPSGDSFTTTSLELLSHARTLSSGVAAITWGSGGTLAAQAGEYGASTLYDVGDIGSALPGVPVAAAIAALIASAGEPAAMNCWINSPDPRSATLAKSVRFSSVSA